MTKGPGESPRRRRIVGPMDDMTRTTTDRLGLEVLSPDECWQLVADADVGRIAFVDAGEPVILPVTHGVHGHQIVFRSGSGTKLSAAQMDQPLAFEVDGWDVETKQGWSVLVRGIGETVYDDDQVVELDALGVEPWLDAAVAGTWVRIRVEEITGRRLGHDPA